MDGLSVYGWRWFRRGNGKLMFCFINSEKFKISTIQW